MEKADAIAKNAIRLNMNTLDKIVDEIIRRETLEHIDIEDSDGEEEVIAEITSSGTSTSGSKSSNISSNSSDSE